MPTDEDIARALLLQVDSATPPGGNPAEVFTIISRTMWRAMCRGIGVSESYEPGAWGAPPNVFDSYTVIYESDEFFSISYMYP